jgi:Holliday junction resolvase
MPNKNYKRGATFEYKIMAQLEEIGFYCIRSAGSHGLVDVMAMKGNTIILIQAKHTKKKTINLTELLKGDNIKKFEVFEGTDHTYKYLAIKQGRSPEILYLRWSETFSKWVSADLI